MNELKGNENNKSRLLEIVSLSTEYCSVCENAGEFEKDEFIDRLLNLLPRIYWEFFDLVPSEIMLEDESYFGSYLEEDYYESIRRHIESLLGEDDVFLETFEEDMKYSDTPIGASIAESLSDIFQPLFNFISIVRDSEGQQMSDAYIICREQFCEYWSQTLCNVLRALNHIKFSNRNDFI